jgi:hypothetical protein
MADSPKAAPTSGMGISVTSEERERINDLCVAEGRPRKAQIMWMVEQRIAEIEKSGRKV